LQYHVNLSTPALLPPMHQRLLPMKYGFNLTKFKGFTSKVDEHLCRYHMVLRPRLQHQMLKTPPCLSLRLRTPILGRRPNRRRSKCRHPAPKHLTELTCIGVCERANNPIENSDAPLRLWISDLRGPWNEFLGLVDILASYAFVFC
jgi:hypothetical protein